MTPKVENKKIKKKLSLKNDIVFKAFFSKEENKEYLIDFLNSILHIEITNIHVQEEVNLEQLSPKEKGGRIDLQAVLNDGMIVNIEMQVKNNHNIEYRNDFYEAKTISRYFPRGDDYKDAIEVISIYILDYNLFGFDEYVSETIKVLNEHRDYQVNCITKEYYIELPKFRKQINVDMDNKLNQWLAFIDGEDGGKIEMAKEKNKVIKKAGVTITYFTPEEKAIFDEISQEMWEFDQAWAKKQARKERNGRTEEKNGIEERKKRTV